MIKEFFFTTEQGNMLIRLIIAHLLSDFVLQSGSMVENKKWYSKAMFLHIGIVYFSTVLLSWGWWCPALIIALIHYVVDGVKIKLQTPQDKPTKSIFLFIADQSVHIFIIIIIWALHYNLFNNLVNAFAFPFTNYKISILLLGYVLVSTPVGYLIKFTLQIISPIKPQTGVEPSNTEQGGAFIGVFERIIIFTLVLLQQYEAIGFLITGKSIIRFASHDEHVRSEYVLVGTMMSYCSAIIIGILINYLC